MSGNPKIIKISIDELIGRHKSYPTTLSDSLSPKKSRRIFLDVVLQEHLKNPSFMTFEQMHDEVKLFLVAGYETSATCLFFTFFLLGHHPEVRRKLYEEISSVCPTISDLSYGQLKELKFLELLNKRI